MVMLPPDVLIEPLLREWLREDIGRGDRATCGLGLRNQKKSQGTWIAKQSGVIVGLPFAEKIFTLLGEVQWHPKIAEGEVCQKKQKILEVQGNAETLLMGERVALNLVMHLSGIATLTRSYVEKIADLPTKLVDTRKTTPGLRILEKYAIEMGGATNHRFGLDDAAMIKENHILVAGGLKNAIAQVRSSMPYPLAIEVETTTESEVEEALTTDVDIIMLDNMPLPLMKKMVEVIKNRQPSVKVEASGNITLTTIREVAQTGVDYVSTSAPITQASWLDLSMKLAKIN